MAAAAVLAILTLDCTSRAAERSECGSPRRTGTLPERLRESSGVAASRRHPGVLWTHDDSDGDAAVFAIDTAGRVLGRIPVAGAENRDWEDIALGPCPAGECLYIADTGDNRGEREDAAIYRFPEPAPGDAATATAERFPLRYPGGRPDVEALYILPGGDVYLISKGRNAPVTVFRYPGEPRADEVVELRAVGVLSGGPVGLPYQVTGADAAPGGRRVAVRSYTALRFYRVGWRGRLRPAGVELDLQALAEPQGEAVAFAPDGTLVVTSEAGPSGVPGTVAVIECAPG